MKFRLARLEDAAEILAIYQPYIEKTAITFEYEVPSLEDFTERVKTISSVFPYIVALDEDTGRILGYAYASRYRERKAYDWVVELSVYVAEDLQHQHVGTALYQRLLAFLTALNYQRAYACITYPNPHSVAFHERLGFHWIGVFEKSGYKFEDWYGICWMDLALQEQDLQASDEVKPVRSISDLTQAEVDKILA